MNNKKLTIVLLILVASGLCFALLEYKQRNSVDIALEVAAELPLPHARIIAPDFSLPDLKGNIVSLSKFRGSVILLGFWTSW